MSLKVFIRQPFTETGDAETRVIQGVLDSIAGLNGRPFHFDYLTGLKSHSSSTFREHFEQEHGKRFTPSHFRDVRLSLVSQADLMVVIRTSMSESSAFEVAYNIFKGKRVPVFFAIWRPAPIKTTLLRDLDDLVPVSYVTFDEPQEIVAPLSRFLHAHFGGAQLARSTAEEQALGGGLFTADGREQEPGTVGRPHGRERIAHHALGQLAAR